MDPIDEVIDSEIAVSDDVVNALRQYRDAAIFLIDTASHNAQVAQLVEQRTENPCVDSSTLSLGTSRSLNFSLVFDDPVEPVGAPGYARYPSITGDMVQIWYTALGGGRARGP